MKGDLALKAGLASATAHHAYHKANARIHDQSSESLDVVVLSVLLVLVFIFAVVTVLQHAH